MPLLAAVGRAKNVTLRAARAKRSDLRMVKPGAVLETLKNLVVPLVAADGGEVWLVHEGDEEVAIHLTGTCSGCPGATLTARGVIEPAVRTVHKGAKVVVTTGMKIPEGAQRI